MGPPPAGSLSAPVFAHGSLLAKLYAPARTDPQQPHDRDEVYVVAAPPLGRLAAPSRRVESGLLP